MSVAEMKLEVINRVTKVDDEAILKEVLTLLEEAHRTGVNVFNLSKTYDQIKDQYGDVLQKLAQ